MTHSDFDLDPRSQQGALAASAAPDSGTAAGEALAHGETANENRKVTFQDTPALWTQPAVVSWRLDPDPSAVNALCKPLSAKPIKRSADLLKRYQLLWTRASRARGIATSTTPSSIQPEIRERLLRRLLRQQSEDEELIAAFPSHRKTRECLEQQRAEDEKIATTIVVECRRLLEDLMAEKMTAQGNCSETGWCERIPPGQFSRVRSLLRIVESRVGPYEGILIARDQVLQCASRPRKGIAEGAAADWIDSRLRDKMALKGEDAMWADFKSDHHVDFSKHRFLGIRKARMAALEIDKPRSGRPRRR